MSLRRLGVYGENLPAKKTKVVQKADYSIGGVIGQFERKYDKTFSVRDETEKIEIFGNNINSAWYGSDIVKSFFNNLSGQDATLYIKSHVGNATGSIDAVVADRDVVDQTPVSTFKVEPAYKTTLEYGISGNRTATKITVVDRFVTASAAIAAATVFTLQLDSVIGIKIGDLVKFVLTAGVGVTAYHKITNIDETAKTITWTDDQLDPAGTSSAVIGDVVSVVGFRVQTYRKSINGIETEVETELGKIICTLEDEVTDYFIENVHAENKYIKLTDVDSASAKEAAYPSTDVDPVYCTSGVDGTAASTAAHWSFNHSAFDDDPIRFMANAETTLEAYNLAGEIYCKARASIGSPMWLYNIPENQTKSQLETIGHSYQRSDDVIGVITANWLGIEDPFSTSVTAPSRNIPNVGAVMAAWIRVISKFGIHYIPAIRDIPLYGIKEVIGVQLLDDNDRTDAAEAGVNIVQKIDGVGVVIRNFFTPSTTLIYQFGNGILMRDFVKVSVISSLSPSENEPNSYDNITEWRRAILRFFYDLWERGSTGNVKTGETFGQGLDDNGDPTFPEDHFEVKADLTNNPQTNINAGQRDYDTYFTYPSPTGSIKIGVGLMER